MLAKLVGVVEETTTGSEAGRGVQEVAGKSFCLLGEQPRFPGGENGNTLYRQLSIKTTRAKRIVFVFVLFYTEGAKQITDLVIIQIPIQPSLRVPCPSNHTKDFLKSQTQFFALFRVSVP
jgi:hypothetical protein